MGNETSGHPHQRSVQARWDGGLRAVVTAGEFEMIVDEPESVPGGTGKGPQPTEVLLASVASCFTIAMAYSANKRGIELGDLDVEATGTYDGPRFSKIRVEVRATSPEGEELAKLMKVAERVCYVTRTLTTNPEVEIVAV
ncbi:OsmC family protein [Pseudonocardia sp. GCM10023141]|uniref:OsmC family protein n=1 Tax=Pseudonocardia sp. GCM10023141 TaxID=3252653 RepID=UPI003609B646